MKKTIFLILTIIGFVSFANAQDKCIASKTLNSKQLSETEEAVKLFWKWDAIDEPEKAVKLLEAISKKDSKNWVAPFWASYIATQLSNQRKENTESLKELNQAQDFFEKSNAIYANETDQCFKPYFHALQSLIYTLKSYAYQGLKNEEKVKEFDGKRSAELNAGIKEDVDNPVLMVLAGTRMASSSNGDFSQIIGAIALLEKAKVKFEKIENRNPVDIGYMNEHWVDNWLNRLKPPKKKSGS